MYFAYIKSPNEIEAFGVLHQDVITYTIQSNDTLPEIVLSLNTKTHTTR